VKVDELGLRKLWISRVKLSREDRSEGAQMNFGSNKSQIMGKAGCWTKR
jgi:hypothetical protein